jgi:Cu2+-exporting ATPase
MSGKLAALEEDARSKNPQEDAATGWSELRRQTGGDGAETPEPRTMTTCTHCGTPFSAADPEEKFCCRGCEYVHELIHNEGFDRFYELRGNATVRPVRSLPFEARDYGWLDEVVAAAEADSAPGAPVEAEFSLEGISCVGCVWLIEHLFLRHEGAMQADVHPATGHVRLRWASGRMDVRAFAAETASYGYALTKKRAGGAVGEARQMATRLGLCGAFAMNAMVFTLPKYMGMPADFAFAGIFKLVVFLSATLAMLVGGSYFIKRAWQTLRMGVIHIDLPIALGLILAYAGSILGWILGVKGLLYFDFVGTFVFLMLLGRYLQISALEKNRNRLQRTRPVPEIVNSPDSGEPLALEEITPGTRFEIRPGQSVPVAATLDRAPVDFSLEWINGEANAQTFHPGRQVPAGAIHLGVEPALLTARETWGDSLLSKLANTHRDAARVPALEKLLRGYLIAVIIIGIAGFAAWWAIAGGAPALQVMISVFVVSCPCALGVALPFADELVGARMERNGVFIREPLLWSRLRLVRTLIFDKTGTLTLERPVLANPEAIENLDDPARLALAVLTRDSLHPVSRTLLESLGHIGQRMLRESGREHPVEDVPGMGRLAGIDSAQWSLGRPGWLPSGASEDGQSPEIIPAHHHDAELRRDGAAVARFRFRETLRPDAAAALDQLRRRGHRLVILSGDRPEKVHAAAERLGIPPEDAHAELTPQGKEALVRQLDRHDTLFLGDGANDSLAFNAAWTTGTPVVDRSLLESKADFYFLGQGLRFLPLLLDLAHRRRRAVSNAFAFALLYNFVAVSVALAGWMNPLVAAIIMPLSSVISIGIVAAGLRTHQAA